MNVKQALSWGSKQLAPTSDSPQLDAELLLREATGLSAAQQIARVDEHLDKPAIQTYQALIAEREKGSPIAYLLGLREFYSLEFIVTPDVLIPRPDTELLVDIALEIIPPGSSESAGTPCSDRKGQIGRSTAADKPEPFRILDLGTGSGAIAVSLARHRPEAAVYAVEQSAAALTVARQNAVIHGVAHIQFYQGSWFEPLPTGIQFDLVVSNPPYIDRNDPHLQEGDVRFEPQSALVADNQGLADYQQIIQAAPWFLAANGKILFEHGCEQGEAVANLLRDAGFIEGATRQDLAKRDRVTYASVRP